MNVLEFRKETQTTPDVAFASVQVQFIVIIHICHVTFSSLSSAISISSYICVEILFVSSGIVFNLCSVLGKTEYKSSLISILGCFQTLVFSESYSTTREESIEASLPDKSTSWLIYPCLVAMPKRGSYLFRNVQRTAQLEPALSDLFLAL